MKLINFREVEDGGTGGFAELPTGGYVAKVVAVSDDMGIEPRWGGEPYDAITITYEIAEGENEGFFEKNNRPDWTHQHEFRYDPDQCTDERDAWRPKQFKSWWSRILPESNPGFEWDDLHPDPQKFAGLLFGLTVRHRLYTKNNGDDGNQLQVQGFYTADAIRSGNFKKPEDVDVRKPKQPAPAAAIYDEEIPF